MNVSMKHELEAEAKDRAKSKVVFLVVVAFVIFIALGSGVYAWISYQTHAYDSIIKKTNGVSASINEYDASAEDPVVTVNPSKDTPQANITPQQTQDSPSIESPTYEDVYKKINDDYAAEQAKQQAEQQAKDEKKVANDVVGFVAGLAYDSLANSNTYSGATGSKGDLTFSYIGGKLGSVSSGQFGFTTVSYIGSKISSVSNSIAGFYSCNYIGDELSSCSGSDFKSASIYKSTYPTTSYTVSSVGEVYFSYIGHKITSAHNLGYASTSLQLSLY